MQRKSGNKRPRTGLWQRCRNLRHLKQIHACMISIGFLSNPRSLRELIFSAAISIPHSFAYARQMFDQIPHPNSFTFITMIRAASHSTNPSLSFSLYARMHRVIGRPHYDHHLVLPFLFRACTQVPSPSPAALFHTEVFKLGLENDGFVRNAMINFHAKWGDLNVASALFDRRAERDIVARSCLIAGYARRGELEVARRLFDESKAKDLVSWNVMITGYAKRGEMGRARELFDAVLERDTVTWNVMIMGYVKCGACKKAVEVFDEMRRVGGKPDEVTMLSLISGCTDSGALDIGMRLHSSLKSAMSMRIGNALIDMYAKHGSIDKSLEVFQGMRDRDVSSWNSVIGGLALHGHGEETVRLFEEMRSGSPRKPTLGDFGISGA